MKTMITFRHACVIMALVMGLHSTATGGVQVRGLGHSSGATVMVEIYADITVTPIISYTFKIHYDPGILRVLHGSRNDLVWYLSDGNNALPYVAPDASVPGQITFVGAKMDGADPLAGVMGPNVLLGWAAFERLSPETPPFDISIGQEGDYASFVTRDGAILEILPDEVTFEGVWPVEHDKDLDGLSDKWEVEFFEDIRLAFYSDDPDGDDYNNLSEEGFGTDPTNRRSHLAFGVSMPDRERLVLEWFSTDGRVYTIEHSQDLERFRPLVTGLKATPPRNTVELEVSGEPDANFYKILLESFPGSNR